MTEPSEHARRAAENIADRYVEFPPGFVTPEQADSAKEIYNLVIAEIATIIDAATAELKAENKELRQQVQDWEHQYKLLAARHPEQKEKE